MLTFIKKRKVLVLISLVALALLIVTVVKIRSNGALETTSPIVGDLVRTVKIAGKVTPKQSVELGFEISGIVDSINRDVGQTVRRGDVVARIDTSTISTEIVKARAELNLAQANLDKLDGANVYETEIENSKRSLIQTIVDAYTASDDAVHNKTDPIFVEPRSSRPEMIYAFASDHDLRESIIKTRAIMDAKLAAWKTLINGLNLSTYSDESLSTSKKYLSEISTYITLVGQAINLFEDSASLSQATIDEYKSDALAARNNLNSASGDLIRAEDKLRGLLLEVPAQVARVEAARASLSNFQSQLAKSVLVSPINGVISKQDAKPGQVVSAATKIVSVISDELEVEAYIPEILISGVSIGNASIITLDAYSEMHFDARVTHIDPAETIRDGVSTYKTILSFTSQHPIIRSGMTANTSIETFRKSQVILIPERAVFREGGQAYVYVLVGEKNTEKILVEVGERDSSGNVELLSNLPMDTRLTIEAN